MPLSASEVWEGQRVSQTYLSPFLKSVSPPPRSWILPYLTGDLSSMWFSSSIFTNSLLLTDSGTFLIVILSFGSMVCSVLRQKGFAHTVELARH